MAMDATKKEQLEKRVVLGLIAVFIVTFLLGPAKQLGLFHRLAPVAAKSPLQASVTPSAAVEHLAAQPAASLAGAVAAAATQYTAHELRDPLESLLPALEPPQALSATPTSEPDVPAPTPPPSLRLQGLVWGAHQPKAIINDEVYGIGDTVAGGTVTSIDRREVTIEFHGTLVSLNTTGDVADQGSPSPSLHR